MKWYALESPKGVRAKDRSAAVSPAAGWVAEQNVTQTALRQGVEWFTKFSRMSRTENRVGLFAKVGVAIFVLTSCGEKEAGQGRAEGGGSTLTAPDSARVAGSVVTYDRGKYSGGATGGVGEFLPISTEEAELSKRLLSRLEQANGEKKVFEEVLSEARTMESRLILDVAGKVMESRDPDVRAQGLMLVDGVTTGEILPLVEKGLRDENLDVRQLAMETALPVKSPAVEKLVVDGIANPDLTIRQTALQVGVNQEGEIAERTLVAGVASPYEDVGMAALALVENELSKRLLPAVMGALDHPSQEIRESARETLYFTFHEPFPSRQAAESWWQENQGQYDDDLVFTEQSVPRK